MQKIEIDELDRKILRLLQSDASLSATAIGEQVGLSQSPCWRRIQRLREGGLILGQVMRFDRKKLGFGILVFAQVKLTAHGRSKVPEFAETIRQFPEVQECHLVLGNIDFQLFSQVFKFLVNLFRFHLNLDLEKNNACVIFTT